MRRFSTAYTRCNMRREIVGHGESRIHQTELYLNIAVEKARQVRQREKGSISSCFCPFVSSPLYIAFQERDEQAEPVYIITNHEYSQV